MIQRLYINNELVDLADNTAITLNYKSNIFGDVSKITSSNSQTIRLPKTTNNRRILDNPTAPAYYSQFRYKRHTCRYEQDGVLLIDGYAVLLDSAEDYEIAIYWGVMSKYQAWVDANPSLTELAGNEYMDWNNTLSVDAYSTLINRGYGYAYYDSGAYAPNVANIHPSASCAWVLNKISEQHGVSFTFPERVQDDLKRLMLPCLTANAGDAYWQANTVNATGHMATTGLGLIVATAYLQAKAVSTGQNIVVEDATFTDNFFGQSRSVKCTIFSVKEANKIRIRFIDFTSGVYTENSQFVVRMQTEDGSEMREQTFPVMYDTNGVAGFNLYEVVDVSDMDTVYFCVNYVTSSWDALSWNAATFKYTPLVDEMTYPGKFDIIPNLPDISQLDFIKALCAMYGIFAMPNTKVENNIVYVGIDDVMKRRGEAYDWTARLVGFQGDDAQDTKFSINDYAQKNWFRYSEDDGVNVNADASLDVGNEALEREKETVKIPFAPSKRNSIIHYEMKTEDGVTTAELLDVKPRIMRLIDNAGLAELSFSELKFKDLLAAYYGTFSDMLNNAIVIKEKVHLDEYSVKDIDFTTPVYLSQYSRYFGIVSLQITGAECTAELVLLPATRIDNHIDIVSILDRIYAVAEHPVGVSVTAEATYLYRGSEKREHTFVIKPGEKESEAIGRTNNPIIPAMAGDETEAGLTPANDVGGDIKVLYSNGTLKSVTPKRDGIYNYIEVHRETITISREVRTETDESRSLYVTATKPVGVDLQVRASIYQSDGTGGANVETTTITMPKGATEVYVGTYIDSKADIMLLYVEHGTDYEYKYIINN